MLIWSRRSPRGWNRLVSGESQSFHYSCQFTRLHLCGGSLTEHKSLCARKWLWDVCRSSPLRSSVSCLIVCMNSAERGPTTATPHIRVLRKRAHFLAVPSNRVWSWHKWIGLCFKRFYSVCLHQWFILDLRSEAISDSSLFIFLCFF